MKLAVHMLKRVLARYLDATEYLHLIATTESVIELQDTPQGPQQQGFAEVPGPDPFEFVYRPAFGPNFILLLSPTIVRGRSHACTLHRVIM